MLKAINILCYVVALLSVLTCMTIALLLIWERGPDERTLYRSMATCAVFLTGSTIVLGLNGIYRRRI